jgi:hypothetical protein
MARQQIRTKLRSNVKRSNAALKSARMADAFIKNVLANDARKVRAEEKRQHDREVNKTRDHHSGNGRITVWRAE